LSSYPESVVKLIEEFGKLPGVGSRTAERLALHLLRVPQEEALALSDAIRELREKIRHCSVCHNISDMDPCHICSDPQRDGSMICVVEEAKDVAAIEKSSAYRGLYHVLMGRYSPLEDMDEKSLTIDSLLVRLKDGEVKEVIIATNPNLEGDATATLLGERLAGTGAAVTRIARGVPQGSQIEHVSGAIISDALKGRRRLRDS
jgi:recombination protein RecR